MNGIRTIVVSCAVLCALAGVSSCGRALEPASATQIDATEQSAAALHDAVFGTAAERGAANFLVNYRANLGQQQCMETKGEEFPISIVNIYNGDQTLTGAADTHFLMPPGLRLVSTSRIDRVEALRAQLALYKDVHETQEYARKSNQCAASEPVATWDDPLNGDQDGRPDSAADLATSYDAMLAKVDSGAGMDSGEYRLCMARVGVGDAEGYDDVLVDLASQAPGVETQPDAEHAEGTAEWQVFLEREAEIAAADVDCRSTGYAQAMAVLAEALGDFERNHADELGRVKAAWAAVERSADDFGYDPSVPVQYVR